MESYQNRKLTSSASLRGRSFKGPGVAGSAGSLRTVGSLVTTHISQHTGIDLYPRSARIRTETSGNARIGGGLRGKIDSFSWGSKSRLSRNAEDAFPQVQTTFALTFQTEQKDGKIVKRYLNTFFTSFRRKYKGSNYLWVHEFQERGIPHFHVYTSLPHDVPGFNEWIAETWNRITGEGEDHLWWHGKRIDEHGNKNCRPWTMENGNYLTKYLDKKAQKMVPKDYGWVGRFWGNSRKIVPTPLNIPRVEFKECYDRTIVDYDTGEITEFDSWAFLTRTLRRHWEASYKRRGLKPPFYTVRRYRKGFQLFKQLENYLAKQPRQEITPF